MELYTFSIINDKNNDSLNEYYRYNSSNEDYTLNNITYKSKYIERDEVNMKFENDDFKITTDLFAEPFNKINSFILNKNLEVTVISEEKKTVIFKGYIINYEIDIIKNTITLYCNNVNSLLKQYRPNRKYSRSCPFALYNTQCSVNKENHKTILNINNLTLSADRKTITSTDTLISDKFNSGILDINDGEQKIHVLNNTENIITLLFPLVIIEAGWNDISIFQGCNKNIADCRDKFNNITNFGGYPFIPSQNITQGF